MRGAIGVILFSDPDDVTNGNFDQVYPHDWYLPPTGTQRGTVYIGDGDPLSPGYPAIGLVIIIVLVVAAYMYHKEIGLVSTKDRNERIRLITSYIKHANVRLKWHCQAHLTSYNDVSAVFFFK